MMIMSMTEEATKVIGPAATARRATVSCADGANRAVADAECVWHAVGGVGQPSGFDGAGDAFGIQLAWVGSPRGRGECWRRRVTVIRIGGFFSVTNPKERNVA